MNIDFEGGWIIASKEAYALLLKQYKDNDVEEQGGINNREIVYLMVIENRIEGFAGTKDTSEFTQFFINNSELSWDKPEECELTFKEHEEARGSDCAAKELSKEPLRKLGFDEKAVHELKQKVSEAFADPKGKLCNSGHIRDLIDSYFTIKNPTVITPESVNKQLEELDAISEMKSRYATGEYDCYGKNSTNGGWLKYVSFSGRCDVLDASKDYTSRYQLILKRHSHIADAVIKDPDVEVYQIDGALLCDFFDEYTPTINYRLRFREEACTTKQASNGGRNNFYSFPDSVFNVDSLNRYWKLTSAEGNILKSLTVGLGSRHDATDAKREVKKCLHYSVERMLWNDFTEEDIMTQVREHFKKVKIDTQR